MLQSFLIKINCIDFTTACSLFFRSCNIVLVSEGTANHRRLSKLVSHTIGAHYKAWNTRFFIFVTLFSNSSSVLLKDTLKAFDDFKNKQKNVWNNVFWYVKVYIFWKCIQYTTHWHKTQILKNFLRAKKQYKNCPLFSFASPNSSQFYF